MNERQKELLELSDHELLAKIVSGMEDVCSVLEFIRSDVIDIGDRIEAITPYFCQKDAPNLPESLNLIFETVNAILLLQFDSPAAKEYKESFLKSCHSTNRQARFQGGVDSQYWSGK